MATPLIQHSTAVEQWRRLVIDGESACSLSLGEDLESYLVFMLMRFANSPEVAVSILAMDFLESLHTMGKKRHEQLRDVGDKCLLFSGLFPGRAERRHVKISYYVELGQNAYGVLSGLSKKNAAHLFQSLCHHFVALMDVMHAMRELSSNVPNILPLQAIELWEDTGSRHALQVLKYYSKSTPIKGGATH